MGLFAMDDAHLQALLRIEQLLALIYAALADDAADVLPADELPTLNAPSKSPRP